MSGPVTTDDLVQGCVKFLKGCLDVVAALSHYPDSDEPYLFQHQLFLAMEGTSGSAVVITNAGSIASPNPHNTMRSTRLGVLIHVDPRRDSGGNVTDPGEAQRRLQFVYRALDWRLHRPQGGQQMWGTVRTITSTRLNEPQPNPVADGGGLLSAVVFYAVDEG